MGPAIGQPSFCSIKELLVEKMDSFVNFISNIFKLDILDKGFSSLLVYIRFRI